MSTKYYVVDKRCYENYLKIEASIENIIIDFGNSKRIPRALETIRDNILNELAFTCSFVSCGWMVQWIPNRIFGDYEEFILLDRGKYIFLDEYGEIFSYDQFELKMLSHNRISYNDKSPEDSYVDNVGFCWVEMEE